MNECKIVEDLLPLYAEDLVSPETKEFVDTHCTGCESCEKLRVRTRQTLAVPEVNADYKKDLKKSVWWIIGKTLIASAVVLGVCLYFLWELGFLNRKEYTAPNGDYRFEVLDCDAGFFPGGACIVTPEGQDISLYGSQSYRDFQVWYHPDSKGYFACITFEDRMDTWLCLEEYDKELGMEVNRIYISDGSGDRDFLYILKESELGQKYLTEDAVITFDRWSEAGQFRGRFIYFNYEVPGGWFGEIVYDVVAHEVVDITCKFTMPPGYFSSTILAEDEVPTDQLP